MNTQRGIINLVIMFVGIVLMLFVLGFFRSNRVLFNTTNYKSLLNLPCGLTVKDPERNTKITLPVTVDGYINGCGWEATKGSAGHVQIFDRKGRALSQSVNLSISPDSIQMPLYFKTQLVLDVPPLTDEGSIVLTSVGGLVYAIPITF